MSDYRLCHCEVSVFDKTGKCQNCGGYKQADKNCICACYRDNNGEGVKLCVPWHQNPSCPIVHS